MSAKTYRDDPANVQLHQMAEQMTRLRRDDLLKFLESGAKPPAMLCDLRNYGVQIRHSLGGLACYLEWAASDITANLLAPTEAAMLRKAS